MSFISPKTHKTEDCNRLAEFKADPVSVITSLSVLTLTMHHDYEVLIHGSRLDFSRNGELWFRANISNSITGHVNRETLVTETVAMARTSLLGLELWHRRFGHIGMDCLNTLISTPMVLDLKVDYKTPITSLCEPCIIGKHHRTPFPKFASNRTTVPLALIHSDLHGPIPATSRQGFQYWVSFVDDATSLRRSLTHLKHSNCFMLKLRSRQNIKSSHTSSYFLV